MINMINPFVECPECHGAGFIMDGEIKKQCSRCNGSGIVEEVQESK